MRKRDTGAAGARAGICGATAEAMTWLASSVPSAPQSGHTTAQGMRLLTGSTSNE